MFMCVQGTITHTHIHRERFESCAAQCKTFCGGHHPIVPPTQDEWQQRGTHSKITASRFCLLLRFQVNQTHGQPGRRPSRGNALLSLSTPVQAPLQIWGPIWFNWSNCPKTGPAHAHKHTHLPFTTGNPHDVLLRDSLPALFAKVTWERRGGRVHNPNAEQHPGVGELDVEADTVAKQDMGLPRTIRCNAIWRGGYDTHLHLFSPRDKRMFSALTILPA